MTWIGCTTISVLVSSLMLRKVKLNIKSYIVYFKMLVYLIWWVYVYERGKLGYYQGDNCFIERGLFFVTIMLNLIMWHCKY